MNKYIVETITITRNRYCVEAKEQSHAEDEIIRLSNSKLDINKEKEFSKISLNELIVSTKKVSDKEFFKEFDEGNVDLIKLESKFKLGFVHKIKYEKSALESLVNFTLFK